MGARFCGAEYFVKIGYASLIQKALDAGGDKEPRDIMFAVATLPPDVLAKEPRIKPVRALTPQWQLVQTPRYKAFTENRAGPAGSGISALRKSRSVMLLLRQRIVGPGNREHFFDLSLGAFRGYFFFASVLISRTRTGCPVCPAFQADAKT